MYSTQNIIFEEGVINYTKDAKYAEYNDDVDLLQIQISRERMNTIINNVVVDRLVDPRKTLSTYGKDIVADGSGTITPKDETKD